MEEKNEVTINHENSFSIIVTNLKKYYFGKHEFESVKAVDAISFQVKKGEFFGLLGPNGAGKTTTISVLTGISSPTEGTASVGGYDIKSELKKIKELIGVCPQEPALYKFLNGLENIEFFGKLHQMPKEEIQNRAEELLKLLGLFEARKRIVKGYSGGMLRQLSLIVALINEPEILFLDEPTVGMDPRARRKVWEFLGTVKQQKRTIILTTHYIEEAEVLCDRVAIMDYGKILAIGPPKQLIEEYGVKNLEEVFMKITGRHILEGI
ncbi:ABC transporter ATP-binding protein [Promethearchaeum syntrophicum]|uniref:ABC transporter ATP-binding protein n=1 Tax=Promethearchaeum syntrophicum TaxID=2594042 RepID=A0A5B9D6X6_9ARCH|nr:ABC transporter ATP-binding protein [Candidatus Prometheoarchaeum syntrophicum]